VPCQLGWRAFSFRPLSGLLAAHKFVRQSNAPIRLPFVLNRLDHYARPPDSATNPAARGRMPLISVNSPGRVYAGGDGAGGRGALRNPKN
jgi:hypothetical protein